MVQFGSQSITQSINILLYIILYSHYLIDLSTCGFSCTQSRSELATFLGRFVSKGTECRKIALFLGRFVSKGTESQEKKEKIRPSVPLEKKIGLGTRLAPSVNGGLLYQ